MNTATQLSYGEHMKLSLRLDKLEQQEAQLRALMNSLIDEEGVYGSNPTTGIVYDRRVLQKQLTNLTEEIKYIIRRLNS